LYDHQRATTYDQYKIPYSPGTTFDRWRNDFVRWTGDASAFGVGLSAQSGSSTWVTIHYNFNQNSGSRYICGNDAKPPSAHRIFAGT
jgi:hypothetical protein